MIGKGILVYDTGLPANVLYALARRQLTGEEALRQSPDDEGSFVLQLQTRQNC